MRGVVQGHEDWTIALLAIAAILLAGLIVYLLFDIRLFPSR